MLLGVHPEMMDGGSIQNHSAPEIAGVVSSPLRFSMAGECRQGLNDAINRRALLKCDAPVFKYGRKEVVHIL
jgi:hypothetical protein